LSAQTTEAQRLSRKKSTVQKSAKESQKRQRETGDYNPFAQEITSGSNVLGRDDFIWTSETAYSSQKKTGNISLTTPTRYGLGQNFELSTILSLNYFAPNLILKKSYPLKKIIVAHRHSLYSPTLGLNWAQKNNHEKIVAADVKIPIIMSLRNELIVSYPFRDKSSCYTNQPFLILTGGLMFDAGIPLEKNILININEHFWGSRSPSLTGNGVVFSPRLRIDARLGSSMLIGGDIKFFFGKFYNNNFAFEQHTGLQTFLTKKFSFSIGYNFSYGHFGNKNFMLIPNADFTFYFGKKAEREKGLFKNKIF